jgi:hypothetical protein
MNFKIFLFVGCFLLISSSILLTSCRKAKLTDAEIESASDNASAEGISNDALNIADQAHQLGAAGLRITNTLGCATVTFDTINNLISDTMIVDFGTSASCVGRDGRYRAGRLIVAYTAKYRKPGADIQISFDNYSVGPTSSSMYQISNLSTKHIVNNGFGSSGFMSWNISSNISIVKPNSGGTITFTESKVRTQIAGLPNAYSGSNKFSINGTASGTTAGGISFTANTVSGKDLIRDMSCPKHFTQGAIDITANGNTKTIDFGSGACDNTATVSKNGKTKTITLK